jgi:hypothetical protein
LKKSPRALLAACFMRVFCLTCSSTLNMEVTCSSEMSVDFQWVTWCYIPEDITLHNHHCENLKSYTCKCFCLFLVEACVSVCTAGYSEFSSLLCVCVPPHTHTHTHTWYFFVFRRARAQVSSWGLAVLQVFCGFPICLKVNYRMATWIKPLLVPHAFHVVIHSRPFIHPVQLE